MSTPLSYALFFLVSMKVNTTLSRLWASARGRDRSKLQHHDLFVKRRKLSEASFKKEHRSCVPACACRDLNALTVLFWTGFPLMKTTCDWFKKCCYPHGGGKGRRVRKRRPFGEQFDGPPSPLRVLSTLHACCGSICWSGLTAAVLLMKRRRNQKSRRECGLLGCVFPDLRVRCCRV